MTSQPKLCVHDWRYKPKVAETISDTGEKPFWYCTKCKMKEEV